MKVQLKSFTIIGRNGREHTFTGRRLGFSTSRTEVHTHPVSAHPPYRYAPRGEKCSACRWFEVYLYERASVVSTEDTIQRTDYDYVVHTVGGSAVPGEQRFSRVEFTHSPFEVIELLTVRRNGAEPYIMAQSSRALAQAAELDDGIREAYVNRAVV